MGVTFSVPVQTDPGAHPFSHTMGTGSFPGVKRPGRGVDHPPPYSAEVKERVDLYIYSTSGPSWPLKADSHIACRPHAVPLPCHALIHTCHAALLPCSHSVVSFLNVRMVARNIRTASPQSNRSSFLVVCFYHSLPRP